ncbi:hypothetical protein LCGC14_2630210, partial [marine sediment metagenome]
MTVDAHAPGTIKLNSLLYDIARTNKGKLRYDHHSGPVERGLGLWEHVVFSGGKAGMGYAAEGEDVPEDGFYYAQNCLTVLLGAISPGPLVKTLAIGGMSTNARSLFGEKDSDGQYYLYACGVGEVAKVKLVDPPTLVSVETASFESTDLFGQAVRSGVTEGAFDADSFDNDAFSTFSSARWILPPDSGDRIIELAEVGIGAAVDRWVVHTAVVDGASHFVVAGRNFWRSIANGRGKKISACD